MTPEERRRVIVAGVVLIVAGLAYLTLDVLTAQRFGSWLRERMAAPDGHGTALDELIVNGD